MPQIHGLITLLLAAMTLVVGCNRGTPTPQFPPGSLPDPDAETFIFYSIDGRKRPTEIDLKSKDRLHGYPILGRVELKDKNVRKLLVDAFKSVAPGNMDAVAACFWPRHAISMTRAGQTTDFLICFECTNYRVFQGGEPLVHNITRAPQSEFNQVLKDAGIPLAP